MFPDIFNPNEPAFTMTELTLAIEKFPNLYGRVEKMNLMPDDGVTTTTVLVEEKEHTLALLPTAERGTPGTKGKTGTRKVISFPIPHIPHEDTVKPEDVQGIRGFGEETGAETVNQKIAEKLQNIHNNQAITLEYMRMGALRGKVLNAQGEVVVDFYKEFKKQKKVINFKLNVATTNVKSLALELKTHIELNLMGEIYGYIHVLCSPEFFRALIEHAKVETAFDRQSEGRFHREDQRAGFEFPTGVVWEEYNGQASDPDGKLKRFIPEGEAIAFPVGTMKTFKTYFAPASMIDTVNTRGRRIYVSPKWLDHGEGVEFKSQSNPLPFCARPEVLVSLKSQ